MITSIRIQNYRSFVDASVTLRPFSLVIGANGAGKSNFLRAIQVLHHHTSLQDRHRHINNLAGPLCIEAQTDEGLSFLVDDPPTTSSNPIKSKYCDIYRMVPEKISADEKLRTNPWIHSDGEGTAQVLESLKSGDREDLFDAIEAELRKCVPEVEKLSLRTVGDGTKQIQIRERGLSKPLPASDLSEGTRIVLCLLTLIHQEVPPDAILLEDIDNGLHPRLLEHVVELMRGIAERHRINVIATTHNPYLVDQFLDDKDAVIIVEKKDGASTLSTMTQKLEGLDYDSVDPDDVPLGKLWFSGLVGGVPLRRR